MRYRDTPYSKHRRPDQTKSNLRVRHLLTRPTASPTQPYPQPHEPHLSQAAATRSDEDSAAHVTGRPGRCRNGGVSTTHVRSSNAITQARQRMRAAAVTVNETAGRTDGRMYGWTDGSPEVRHCIRTFENVSAICISLSHSIVVTTIAQRIQRNMTGQRTEDSEGKRVRCRL